MVAAALLGLTILFFGIKAEEALVMLESKSLKQEVGGEGVKRHLKFLLAYDI